MKYFIFFVLVFLNLHGVEKKIALLFLTRSDLNQADLWKEWIDPNLYTVYNHAAEPPKDPWLAKFSIGAPQPNSWGYLLLAQRALFRAAIKDPSNYKFILLSESCVPLRTPKQVYEKLTADNMSYISWRDIWWRGASWRTVEEFPVEHQLGHSQWIILNRAHAQMMAEDDYWVHFAHSKFGGDETYPATLLSMKGVLHECYQQNTTFLIWQGTPYIFNEATEENIKILIDAKRDPFNLFARKFSPLFPSHVLKHIQNTDP